MPGRTAFVLLIVLLAWSPLILGSNRPVLWAINGALAGLCLVTWAIGTCASAPAIALRYYGGLAVGLLAVGLFIAVQYVPFVPAWVGNEHWRELARVLGTNEHAISVDRGATLRALLKYFTYLTVGFLALQLCRQAQRAERLLMCVFWIVVTYATYGLAVYLADSDRILWFDRFAYFDVVVGPFIARNAFAAFIGVGILVGVAMLLTRLSRVAATGVRNTALFTALSGLLSPILLALFLLGTAQLLTASRAGTVATLTACLFMVLVWALTSPSAGAARKAVSAMLVAMVAGIATLSGALLFDRLEMTDTAAAFRVHLYDAALQAIAHEPLLGWGAGTYPAVFPTFRPEGIPGARTFAQAHNTYLETAATLGLVATPVLLVALGYISWRCLRAQWVRRSNRFAPLAALGVSTLFALHAFVDFSLQIQANALLFSALLGAGLAQSWRTGDLESPGKQAPAGESKHGP